MVKKSPYELMQLAVDIVNSSEHPSNKVAAVISGRDSGGEGFNLAHTNFWPETIIGKIGIDKRIGDTSGTIHAETACIIKSPGTEGAVICVTDPVCPNCAKNIVEAGISEVYIDHKGFDKDFVNRRREYFQTMSLHICKKAGVPVYKIWRKDRRIEALIGFGETEEFRTEKNFYINSNFTCLDSLASLQMVQRKEDFAIAIGEKDNEIVALIAESGLVYGLDNNKRFPRIKNDESKYNYIIEPLNRLLMNSARLGIDLDKSKIFSNRIPTAREQVNISGAGFNRIVIGNMNSSRDLNSLQAKEIMDKAGILRFEALQ